MTGEIISHYEVLEKIGSGGMGVVFKARDLKLGRTVALKFLSEHLARDREAIDRFEREARAASALNHPGICTIHEIEEVDGRVFLAMELLEGISLKERLHNGPLPFKDVLDYAVQIADALQAAHAKGICHRDIKPGNLFLVNGGRVKVLDFGLAKFDATESTPGDLSTLMSMPGVFLGTVAYMSPEQALGQTLDARTDLFSFGLVLFEMATGRQAFTGPTAAILEAVLNRQPPGPSTIVAGIPPAFDRLVEKALEKDREMRFQAAAELGADLKRVEREAHAAVPSVPANIRHVSKSAVAAMILAGAVLSAVAVYIATRGTGGAAHGPLMADARFTQITTRPGLEGSPSLSPDGHSVVYASRSAGNWDIYLDRIEDKQTTNLTVDTAADDVDPAFSPDGRQVAFRSERDGGGIFVMDVDGRSVRRVTNFGHNPAWSPDQKSIVCATERVESPGSRLASSTLWVVDVASGQRRQLTTSDAVQPHWSPGGERIAYWTSLADGRGIWTIPATGGEPVRVIGDQTITLNWNPVWSPDGRHLFFASDRGGAMNLWRIRIDAHTGRTLGPPEAVTTSASTNGFISLSRDGSRIAYQQQTLTQNVSRRRFDRPGDPPEAITRGTRRMRQPEVSPDGKWIAYNAAGQSTAGGTIAVSAADGSNLRDLLDGASANRAPRWSPDGSRIAFYSNRSGTYQIWTVKSDGSDLRQITDLRDTKGLYYPIWSIDGTSITCSSFDGSVFSVDPNRSGKDQQPRFLPPLPESGTSFVAWAWSPSGRKLAGWQLMPDGTSGGIEIYEPESGRYRKLPVVGSAPTWLDGGETRLLVVSNQKLQTVDVATGVATDAPTPPGFNFHYTLTRDGRWLYYTHDERDGDIWLITLAGSSGR